MRVLCHLPRARPAKTGEVACRGRGENALLAGFAIQDTHPDQMLCCTRAGGAPAAKGKGGKGGKSAAEAEEIDALLAELDAPEQPAAEAAGGGKKKKKKKVCDL